MVPLSFMSTRRICTHQHSYQHRVPVLQEAQAHYSYKSHHRKKTFSSSLGGKGLKFLFLRHQWGPTQAASFATGRRHGNVGSAARRHKPSTATSLNLGRRQFALPCEGNATNSCSCYTRRGPNNTSSCSWGVTKTSSCSIGVLKKAKS